MHILITGGCGFIGSHLATYFVENDERVTIADRFTYAGKARPLEGILPYIDLLIGDLAQGDLPQRCREVHPDAIIHCAAETHVDRSIMDPTTFLVSNAIGTSRLLEAVRGLAVPIVIYSTDEVYGPQPDWTSEYLRVETSPYAPSNAYSASKVAVEAVAHAFRVTHGMDIRIVRPCNVFGPGQHPEKAIPKWTHQLLDGLCPTVYNEGIGFRDWMYVDDHCRAIETVLRKGKSGEVYNIAGGQWKIDREVLESVMKCLKIYRPPNYIPGRKGHDHGYAMDGTKLRALGWKLECSFMQKLLLTVDWARQNRDYWRHDAVHIRHHHNP